MRHSPRHIRRLGSPPPLEVRVRLLQPCPASDHSRNAIRSASRRCLRGPSSTSAERHRHRPSAAPRHKVQWRISVHRTPPWGYRSPREYIATQSQPTACLSIRCGMDVREFQPITLAPFSANFWRNLPSCSAPDAYVPTCLRESKSVRYSAPPCAKEANNSVMQFFIQNPVLMPLEWCGMP